MTFTSVRMLVEMCTFPLTSTRSRSSQAAVDDLTPAAGAGEAVARRVLDELAFVALHRADVVPESLLLHGFPFM